MFKVFLKRILLLLTGIIMSMVLPILIKQFILRPVRFNIIGDNIFGQLFQWGFSLLLILAGYISFVKFIEKRKADELSMKRVFPDMFKGIAWGMLSIGGILLLLALTGSFSVSGVNSNIHTYQMVLMLFLLSTTEEILYRGLFYRLIEKWYGTAIALIISSILFSILHLGNDYFNLFSFLAIITGGMIMGLIYTKTRSLWWPIAAHFSWNYTQVIMGVRLSGTDQFNNLSLFNSSFTGNTVLTGGDFGVENSIITILYTVIVVIVLWRMINEKGAAESRP
jgi:CAAX protease family protein